MEKAETVLPEISGRMMAAVEMVTKGSRVADIGCDHGYVSIWLYKKGIAKSCIASDVNEGPLIGAEKNITFYRAAGGVSTRLSNGLAAFTPGEADCILITGMGGPLMERILKEGKEVVLQAKELILEPQSDASKVREILCTLGFRIIREKMVSECGKYYPVIKAVKADGEQKLSEAQLKYGLCMSVKDDRLFQEFLFREKSRYEMILDSLKKKDAAPGRCSEIEHELILIEEVLCKGSTERQTMKNTSTIILASGSPRRRELLKQIGIEPVVIPSGADENTEETRPDKYVEELSGRKCLDIASKTEEGIVLGADTVVSIHGEILGKPKDKEDAFRMLKSLQGNVHQVYTGVTLCLVKDGKTVKRVTFSEKTDVAVSEMIDEEIEKYIATGEPMDKAGAYGIQGYFAKHIGRIDGDYFNVVGLPLAAVYENMKKL